MCVSRSAFCSLRSVAATAHRITLSAKSNTYRHDPMVPNPPCVVHTIHMWVGSWGRVNQHVHGMAARPHLAWTHRLLLPCDCSVSILRDRTSTVCSVTRFAGHVPTHPLHARRTQPMACARDQDRSRACREIGTIGQQTTSTSSRLTRRLADQFTPTRFLIVQLASSEARNVQASPCASCTVPVVLQRFRALTTASPNSTVVAAF